MKRTALITTLSLLLVGTTPHVQAKYETAKTLAKISAITAAIPTLHGLLYFPSYAAKEFKLGGFATVGSAILQAFQAIALPGPIDHENQNQSWLKKRSTANYLIPAAISALAAIGTAAAEYITSK